MAPADVYDALRSNSCFKRGISSDDTCKIILKGKGERFDPGTVDVLLYWKKTWNFQCHGRLIFTNTDFR
jgi:HD-GYP domain-containing protein (c-di-GMP phosphodiesterase class II)